MERLNVNFRLVATMTQASSSNIHWNGRAGRIDADFLLQVAGNLPEHVYYIAGQPTMVQAMHEVLATIGIADGAIHSEGFYGY